MTLATEEHGVDDVSLGAGQHYGRVNLADSFPLQFVHRWSSCGGTILYYLCQELRGAGDNYTFDPLGTSHTAIQGSFQLAVGRTFAGHDGHSSTREDWVNGQGSTCSGPTRIGKIRAFPYTRNSDNFLSDKILPSLSDS